MRYMWVQLDKIRQACSFKLVRAIGRWLVRRYVNGQKSQLAGIVKAIVTFGAAIEGIRGGLDAALPQFLLGWCVACAVGYIDFRWIRMTRYFNYFSSGEVPEQVVLKAGELDK